MRGIIVGPENDGEGVYSLLTEEGEHLFDHYCSNASFAPGDLYQRRPERTQTLKDKNIDDVVWIKDSGLTYEQLIERNHSFYEAKKASTSSLAGTRDSYVDYSEE